jgi:hypothetical protein
MALGKIATQSSTYAVDTPAADAVNGNLDDYFHTNSDQGKFNFMSTASSQMVLFKLITTLMLFLFFA